MGWNTRPAAAREPAAPPREPVSIEDLLGGRVLGWVGGAAVVLGVAFFLVMAASRGWIDETTRVLHVAEVLAGGEGRSQTFQLMP